MNITKTTLDGLLLIELDNFGDNRGFFVERFNKKKFTDLGLNIDFVQDNFSLSIPSVIRGLHYQKNPSQTKLVGCLSGKIWDVAVDIRKSSPTFGQYFGIELTPENGKLLLIPEGFAHGFCVIGNEKAGVFYKVNNYFSKEGDGGILYNDRQLGIKWPIDNPIISDKDMSLLSIEEYLKCNAF